MPRPLPTCRPPLARMLEIHQAVTRGQYPNCQQLARDLEVSAKTVQRDIDFMRDRWGLPLEYDSQRFGYYYTRNVGEFPMLQVGDSELLALFLAGEAMKQYQGTPFAKPLQTVFGRLAATLDGDSRISIENLAQALSIRNTGVSKTDLQVFDIVSRAVRDSRCLQFSYHKLNTRKPERRRVQPLHLACINHQWYLFAHDLVRRGGRTFALPRIQGKPRLGARFKRPDDFSLPRHLAQSFGVFSGAGNHRIRIGFTPFAARLIREREWHPSQKITEFPNGAVELQLRLGSFEEVERWILGWGSEAEVIAPTALKRRVAEAIGRMHKTYAPDWFSELHHAKEAQLSQSLMQWLASTETPDPNQLRFSL